MSSIAVVVPPVALLPLAVVVYIRSVPIKNRLKEELLRAYRETYEWLTLRGFKPLLHKMDNETSHEVKNFI